MAFTLVSCFLSTLLSDPPTKEVTPITKAPSLMHFTFSPTWCCSTRQGSLVSDPALGLTIITIKAKAKVELARDEPVGHSHNHARDEEQKH